MFGQDFPRLHSGNCRITSAQTFDYNCIAWAAGVSDKWWWPVKGAFWPSGYRKEDTVDNFIQTFTGLGYEISSDPQPKPGFTKIALYVKDGKPKHMARLLPSGAWTSKLGPNHDIEHDDPFCIEGPAYGEVFMYFVKEIEQ